MPQPLTSELTKHKDLRCAQGQTRGSKPFSIEGDIRDNQNLGIPGVSVHATLKDAATTDDRGYFAIRGLDRSQPSYSLNVEKPGYKFQPVSAKVTSPA
jgi:Carboxypeptidase regulatory-like domain